MTFDLIIVQSLIKREEKNKNKPQQQPNKQTNEWKKLSISKEIWMISIFCCVNGLKINL